MAVEQLVVGPALRARLEGERLLFDGLQEEGASLGGLPPRECDPRVIAEGLS